MINYSRPWTNHGYRADSNPFLFPPENSSGNCFDLSDRLLTCCSSNMRNEIVVGGSDHALYSLNLLDKAAKPKTMYTKNSGHTDWVTSVSHLPSGKVISGGMDGKICLWSENNRSICVDLQKNNSFPVSKVLTDMRSEIAFSSSYDGKISIWSLDGIDVQSSHRVDSRIIPNSQRNVSAYSPAAILTSHQDPVLELNYQANSKGKCTLVSGDKAGSMIVWDLDRLKPMHKFRAHPGLITGIELLENSECIATTGTDGYLKIWDPRTTGSGLIHKIPLYYGKTSSSSGNSTTNRQVNRRLQNNINPVRDNNSNNLQYYPISCMSSVYSRGSSSDASYIITGGGSPEDSSLNLVDLRNTYTPVARWDHHQNGVYSLCVVGDSCVFSGDGVGNLLCHNILEMEFSRPRRCLKYGISASSKGAVRAINYVDGKITACGEDGNVLVFDY